MVEQKRRTNCSEESASSSRSYSLELSGLERQRKESREISVEGWVAFCAGLEFVSDDEGGCP